MQRSIATVLLLFFLAPKVFSQPFADIANFNFFPFHSVYKDHQDSKTAIDNYNFSLFFPKEFKNGNTLLIKGTEEIIHLKSNNYYNVKLNSVHFAIGSQFLSENKKWKYLIIGIPKFSFNSFYTTTKNNFHYSAVGLITFIFKENLKFKTGIYYSKEFFGNFFVPLASVEWKINRHWSTYGVLPSNYRIEYRFNNKLYAGLNFKSYTRSFLGAKNTGYIKNEEMQLKLFFDYFFAKRFLAYLEAGRTINYKIEAYDNSDLPVQTPFPGVFLSPFKDNFFLSGGLAYRIRLDLE